MVALNSVHASLRNGMRGRLADANRVSCERTAVGSIEPGCGTAFAPMPASG